jgi:Ternary complex associated domain 9
MSDQRVGSTSGPYSPSPSPRGVAAADEILTGLSSPSEATFLRALARLSTRPREASATIGFLDAFLSALRKEPRLTDRTRADRLTAVLRRLAPSVEELTALAMVARSYPAGIRMAVAQVLPPAQRVLLAPNANATPPDSVEEATAPVERTAQAFEGGVTSTSGAVPETELTRRAVHHADTAPVADGTIGMVAILTQPDRQEANKRLLNEKGFAAVPWHSVESLRAELSTNCDVCACVVDGSILTDLDTEAQRQLFTFLGGYSTFLWIRIHEHGLRLPIPAIRELVKHARCARGMVAQVTVQSDAMLRPSELDDFRHSAETLQASAGASFVPGELREDQVRVLVAAVREYWNAQEIGNDVQIRVLETRFISGGRSGAVLIRIRVNGAGQPLIAKLGPVEWIINESRRLRTFIEQWERAVHPETFLHGSWGVILFPLVCDEQDRDAPADTLEERLVDLWNDQVMGSHDGTALDAWDRRLERRRESLIGSLRVLTATLASLNQRRPPSATLGDTFPPFGNPWIQPLERLETEGVQWIFSSDVRTARTRAQARLARLNTQAVVHGDIHLRNVLLRSQQDATLIDFASCGPGHPAVDLARLDVVLFTEGMRQLVTEQRCAEFQRSLSLERASIPALQHNFSDLLSCHVNVVCAEGAVLARDAADTVLQRFGGTADDYLAAKYLVALQALLQVGRSTAMVRAIVEALTPALLRWPAID